jgi:YhcN/YlaJ family sporulation lipoprotein
MKKSILLFIIILSLVFQLGCRASENNNLVDLEETKDLSVEASIEDKIIIDRSEDLSDYVVELFGIDDAATIIFNDTALIGVVIAYDREIDEDIKQSIENIVMEKDKEIKKVLISDDEKTFNQIVNIINGLMNGSSYDNYVSEISKTIEKINKKH